MGAEFNPGLDLSGVGRSGLGGKPTVRLPQKAVWVCNGNNLKIRGVYRARTFPIRLDAKLSRPWERQDFKQKNLRNWVSQWRGDFLAAILTIGRAWFIAQKPEPKKPLPVMGGFESWIEIIGGILSFAGIEGFLEILRNSMMRRILRVRSGNRFWRPGLNR